MRGRGFLVAVAMAAVASLGTWAQQSEVAGKIPGETHCYKDVCHRVYSLDETRAMIGRTSDQVTTHYDEPGIDKFNVGQYTSSGEEFDASNPARTSASNFPDGTELLVWHPVTRKAAHVRVNDFGPFWGKRTLDVTRRVAEDLGFAKDGVATLRVTVIWAPLPGEPRYRRGRVYPPTFGLLGVVDPAQHPALVQRLVAGALSRNGYKGPEAPVAVADAPPSLVERTLAEREEDARAAARQMDRDAAMVIAGLPRPPVIAVGPVELAPIIADAPRQVVAEATMDAAAEDAVVAQVPVPPPSTAPAIAPSIATTPTPTPTPDPPVDVAPHIPGSGNPNQSTVQVNGTDGRQSVASSGAAGISVLRVAVSRSLADALASPLTGIGIAVMLTSLWGAGALGRSRKAARRAVPVPAASAPIEIDASDPLATAKRAVAQAERDARDALQRDYTAGMRISPDIAVARDTLGRELARRELEREADVRARLRKSQDEQARLARELADMEAVKAATRATPPPIPAVRPPIAATIAAAGSEAGARPAVPPTSTRRDQERAAQAAREAQAARDAKLATMPKHLSRELAAAVLGLEGSEKFWGNILIAQATLQGEVKSGSALRVDGVIDGSCQAPVIMVSAGAVVTGTIAAETIIVLGTVQGRVIGRNITIASSAKVEGDMYYHTLSLDQAAQCDLRFSHLPADVDPMQAVGRQALLPISRAA